MPIKVRQKQVDPTVGRQISMPRVDYSGSKALAQSVQKFGEQLYGVGALLGDIQERDDKIATKSSLNEAKKSLMEQFVTYKTLQGRSAVGTSKSYKEFSQKVYQEKLDSLENPNQKQMFQREMEPIMANYEIDMYAYEQGEIQKWGKQEGLAKRDNAIQSASLHMYDPIQLNADLQEAVNETRDTYSDLGDEVVKREVQNTLTIAHNNIIDAMLKDDANPNRIETAKDYFESNKESINADARTSLDQRIQREESTQWSQNKADEIYRAFNTGSPNDYQNRVEEARKIEDAGKRKEVLSNLDTMKTRDEAAKKEIQNSVLNQKTNAMLTASQPNKETGLIDPNWRINVLNEANNSDPEVRPTLLKYANSLISGGGKIVTNREVYQTLMAMDHGTFSGVNLTEYSPYLSDADYKKFVDMQTREIDSGQLTGVRTVAQKVKASGQLIGLDPDTKNVKKKAEYTSWADEIERDINKWETANNKKITPEEENRIINNKVIEKKLGKFGESATGGLFKGRGADITWEEAIKNGTDSSWLPVVDDKVMKELITQEIVRDGVYDVSDITIRMYARKFHTPYGLSDLLTAEAQQYRKTNTAIVTNE